MPELDELIAQDAARWRADIDRHAAQVRVAAAMSTPSPRRRRRATPFSGSWRPVALAAAGVCVIAAAVVSIMIATAHAPSARPGQGGGGAAASCAGPTLTLNESSVVPGQAVRVSGRYFVADCNDTRVNGQTPPPNPPVPSVELVLLDSAAARHDLMTVHPDATGAFQVVVRIPVAVPVGPATIVDAGGIGRPATLEVEAPR